MPRPAAALAALFSLQVELTQVGGQYANALVEVAQAHNCLEAVHTDIDSLATVLKDSKVRCVAGRWQGGGRGSDG